MISLALLCLTSSLGAIASLLLWQNLLSAEKQQTQQHVDRALDAIAKELSDIDADNPTLSSWDDTYNFVVSYQEEYLHKNFNLELVAELGINLVMITNESRKIIATKGFDIVAVQEVDFPPQLIQHFANQPQLLIHSETTSRHQGLLVIPDSPPILISSRPILTSLKQGPARGTFILGKFLDRHKLQQISQANRLNIKLYSVHKPHLPIPLEKLIPFGLSEIKINQESRAWIHADDESTISSYLLLKDNYGQPSLILQVDSPRTSYQQGKLSWSYLMFFIVLLGGGSTAITYKLTQKLMRYLQERDGIQRELFLEKELAHVTLQSINEGIITVDRDGCIKDLNPIAEQLTGYLSHAATGKSFAEIFWVFEEQTKTAQDGYLENVLQTGEVHHSPDRDLLRNRYGREFAIDYSIAPIRSALGEIMGAVVVFRDVSESRKMAQQLSWQASYDPLTGLANRREFERYLRRAIATAKRERREHTLAFLDLDRFKIVNDTSGHIAGDELLRQVSMLLQDNLRQADLIARFGGDEFAILLYGCPEEEAVRIVQNLVDIIKGFRFVWQDKLFTLGASVGITAITTHSSDITQILSRADAACYIAKEQGRNQVYVYRSEDNYLSQPHGEMEWAGKIQEALKFGGFQLYYQTIVPLRCPKTARIMKQKTGLWQESRTNHRQEAVTSAKDSKITPLERDYREPDYRQEHYEILLRLVDENNNLITPGVFIPAAERYQLMPTIDRWVVKTLFSMKEIWETYRDHQHHALFTINLSGASLNEESFWEFLTSQIALHQIPPHLLCFEITETVAITNITKTSRFIRQMRELGCSFSLDDFGSGMSSFGYLKNLPVDYLKIDGEFIKDIIDSSTNAEIAAAIHRIGHVMGMQTIAEYVTNQEVWQKVLEIGIDYAQGYYIHQPQPLTAEVFLESRQVS